MQRGGGIESINQQDKRLKLIRKYLQIIMTELGNAANRYFNIGTS
jgi:hypothetical protein